MAGIEEKSHSEGENNDSEFQQLYEQSLKQLNEGELVRGTVVNVSRDSVVVDIGYKSEGLVPIEDFLDADGNCTVSQGDEVSVFLERWEDDQGYVVLSKNKADQMAAWTTIMEVVEKDGLIEGTITRCVNGGFHVDIGGVTAFLPNSQVDIIPVKNPESIVGTTYEFKVLKHNRRKNNVIISRRVILEKERESLREKTLETIEEGAVVKGLVKNITDYGAFVDLGGIDGLLHLTDLSWGKVTHPSQILSAGDEIDVKILKFDKEDGKISLGLKQTKADPWINIAENYPVNSKVSGKVVNLTDYGAFVELSEGLEGLIHISEMSWTKIRHPSQKLKQGDVVEVMVLDIDPAAKRISLGLKQVEANPWDDLNDRYPVGSTVTGSVKNITDFGVFVGIEDGVDGLIHISDLTWKKIKHPSELYKKGQEVSAEVIHIDKSKQRFSLSTKVLESNPWEGVEDRYKPGMIVEGRVTGVADFGAFIELEQGLEGLVHISEINRGKQSGEELGVGDMVEVEVLNVDSDEKKVGLSIRKITVKAEPSTQTQGSEESAAITESTDEASDEAASNSEEATGEDSEEE
ncbi:MAG: 30S ribosomal protein S1 [Deltaproteobacteria bacterium]|nr:30S ribosomal protein S1 [Deltaproteobacteria bacterium]